MTAEQSPLVFIGSSRRDLCEFPEDVTRIIGHALRVAQSGGRHPDAKPLTGDRELAGAGVLEVVEDWQGDTYRAVYAVRFRVVGPSANPTDLAVTAGPNPETNHTYRSATRPQPPPRRPRKASPKPAGSH